MYLAPKSIAYKYPTIFLKYDLNESALWRIYYAIRENVGYHSYQSEYDSNAPKVINLFQNKGAHKFEKIYERKILVNHFLNDQHFVFFLASTLKYTLRTLFVRLYLDL
ncbi:hypothetical protein BpHYR1_049481 [Brachionus plicatilis]|uniref:Uncharacterized protein n=1 Tax=Brachionus plicatilis TaxID=10195 RepID=A0A3M7REJ6_BRAPC|nr:hypothetical protein BpHYR1_049481 [Brachionus plicatilis]